MTTQNEIWKNIKDYEDIYQVSNLGRVKSLDKKWCENISKAKLGKKMNLEFVEKQKELSKKEKGIV